MMGQLGKEQILCKLSEDWDELTEIVIFGFGRTSIRNIDKLAQDFQIIMIIDNDPAIHGKVYGNCKVQNFDEVKSNLQGKKIIISTSAVAYAEISKLLNDIGLQENKDFCRLKDFMAEWYWRNRKQVCLSQTFSSVISDCTFNCRHCNFFAPYFKCKEQYEYDEHEILKDFDHYFKVVDYVASWSIMGGEPLLNKHLSQIIEAVYEKYGDKIGYIQVISNGSLMPDEKLIQAMKQCNVRMRLSDYTHVIPYEKRLGEVKECLEREGIPYEMSVYHHWYDIGTRTEVIPELAGDEAAIAKHMRLCAPGCHQLNECKFFFCGQVFAYSKLGLCKLEDGDCIELEQCTGSVEDKEQLLKYCMGYPQKGYISTCGVCYGMGTDNDRVVKVAEQM